jgi:hypothetical protein
MGIGSNPSILHECLLKKITTNLSRRKNFDKTNSSRRRHEPKKNRLEMIKERVQVDSHEDYPNKPTSPLRLGTK